jgi:hypothetical protein
VRSTRLVKTNEINFADEGVTALTKVARSRFLKVVSSPGSQIPTGTNGRWRYFPGLDVFALVNLWDQDAFALRLP